MEAGAELGEFLDGGEPAVGYLREHLAPPEGQVGEGSPVGASHAAAYLMQLREPQPVSILDDEGIHVGNVHAGLDYGGADEYIDFVFEQAVPDVG